MGSSVERILIVESNPEISSFIALQALNTTGYQIVIEADASAAFQRAVKQPPDVILANLDLPGLSGKDLLVGLNSQGIHAPVIMIGRRGMENQVIQTFQLGAVDYLMWPVREAEIVAAVERALSQVRVRREREYLADELKSANSALEQRVSELTVLQKIGKAVVSITDQQVLFERIVQGAVLVSEADFGWFLMREENSKNMILIAHHNLPRALLVNLNKPWDDGASSMVALSGEPLSIHGEPIQRLKISYLGKAALAVPVKVKKEVIGLLEVARRQDTPFSPGNQKLLEAMADYISISIVNARLFRFLEERAKSLQQIADLSLMEARLRGDLMHKSVQELQDSIRYSLDHLARLLKNQKDPLNSEQIERLRSAQVSLEKLIHMLDLLPAARHDASPPALEEVNLGDLIRRAIVRYQPIALDHKIILKVDLPQEPLLAKANTVQVAAVIDGLLSNAVKFSLPDSVVEIHARLDEAKRRTHVWVKDHGIGISSADHAQVFSGKYRNEALSPGKSGGVGIGLALMKKMIETNGGKIWLVSTLGHGSEFHFSLPFP